jgi:hypothetical protein
MQGRIGRAIGIMRLLQRVSFNERDSLGATNTWREDAKCRDLSPSEADKLFFESKSEGGRPQQGKEFCMGCPVRTECRDSGFLGNEEFGTWGGVSARDLRTNAKNPEKFHQVKSRHPEIVGSYLEWLPPRREQSRVLDGIAVNGDYNSLDGLENPLDSLSGDEVAELNEQSLDAIVLPEIYKDSNQTPTSPPLIEGT